MQPSINILMEKELKDSFSIKFCDNTAHSPEYSGHRLVYNRVLLIKGGEGSVMIDEHVFPILPDSLLLLAKGQVFVFMPGSRFTGYELSFGDCFWEKAPASASNCKAILFNTTSTSQQLCLSGDDYNELAPLFRSLHMEFLKDSYSNKIDAMAAYLKIIMIKMANINALLVQRSDSYEDKVYRQFTELINLHYQRSHEVADYARMLGIPARKLTELSKKCSGKGAKELINGQLIAEAKRMLQFSSSPVKEIAFTLNFSGPDQFSHFFKKNTFLSPQDYRNRFINTGG